MLNVLRIAGRIAQRRMASDIPGCNLVVPTNVSAYRANNTSTTGTAMASAHGDSIGMCMSSGPVRYQLRTNASQLPTTSLVAGYRPAIAFSSAGTQFFFLDSNSEDNSNPYLLRGGSSAGATESFAVSIWVKFATLAATQGIISRSRESAAGGWYAQYLIGSTRLEVRARVNNGETTPSVIAYLNFVPVVDTWYRITIAYDHTVPSISIQLNTTPPSGNNVATMSTTIALAPAPVRIGAKGNTSAGATTTYLNGSVGEVVAIKRANFTADEHAFLQARHPLLTGDPTIIQETFSGGTGATIVGRIPDVVSNGNAWETVFGAGTAATVESAGYAQSTQNKLGMVHHAILTRPINGAILTAVTVANGVSFTGSVWFGSSSSSYIRIEWATTAIATTLTVYRPADGFSVSTSNVTLTGGTLTVTFDDASDTFTVTYLGMTFASIPMNGLVRTYYGFALNDSDTLSAARIDSFTVVKS